MSADLIALARSVGATEPFTMDGVFIMDGVLLEAFAAALSHTKEAAPSEEQDARRYRFLRSQNTTWANDSGVFPLCDEEVDAAIAATQAPEETK